MRVPFIVLTAGLAAALVFAAAPAKAQQCGPLQRAMSLDLIPGPGGARFGVPVTVNGLQKRFLLSTGNFVSRLSSQTVAELKLSPRSQGRLLAANGTVRNARIVTVDLEIGPMKAAGQEMLVMENEGPFDGMFGPNLMQNYDIEFDFAGRKLNYFLTDHCEGRVVYWPNSGFTTVPFTGWDNNSNQRTITIPVTLDGHEIHAEIDTIEPGTILDADAASALFNLTPASPGAVPLGAMDANPNHRIFGWTFKELKIGGVTITNLRLRVVPDLVGTKTQDTLRADSRVRRRTDDFLPTMRLGMDVLRRLHLYLAAKEGKIYLTAAPN
jgi:hypothetical protein